MMSDNEELIKQQLLHAYSVDDIDGFTRALRDLESLGWEDVNIYSRVIGRYGERIEVRHYLDGRIRVIGGSRAFKIVWILRFKIMVKYNDHRYLKHVNEMSPEEYEWVFLQEEFYGNIKKRMD